MPEILQQAGTRMCLSLQPWPPRVFSLHTLFFQGRARPQPASPEVLGGKSVDAESREKERQDESQVLRAI